MIPGDLAARLRLLTEASFFDTDPPLAELKGVRPIPADLPDYRPGDRLTAQIQKALPDGTFEGLVDGKTIKLALPQNARPGDTLELVVARQTPRAVLAHTADTAGAAAQSAAQGGARPALSHTGQLISFLLTGQPAPKPAALAGGQPLANVNQNTPPQARALASSIKQAIDESGLFYEAQQARWLSGKTDLASLLRQPQGQQSPLLQGQGPLPPAAQQQSPLPGQSAVAPQGDAASTKAGTATGIAQAPNPVGAPASRGAIEWIAAQMAEEAAQAAGGADKSAQAQAAAGASAARSSAAERLLPVMHQQLDALATHHYVWQGQAWPGQDVEIEIEDPDDGRDDPEDNAAWRTTLRLTLPALGGVEARLELDRTGIRVRMTADESASVRALNQARGELASALEAANVPLKNLHVSLRDGRSDT
ncbi:flagellar hook-length control protein FliK [Nitrogeniibacter aestuarii]|uniref:flagellar hook-length control protein FliK n=1 Tax=Nitrogeniibacter aestuarii TaxID=2815343 RepID=UPI001E5B06AA|nr:flagellar hook-length control protein FliK [Nitrogeniibacter aestuarii]